MKSNLYEIYYYSDYEGSKKTVIGYTMAERAEQALKQCTFRLNVYSGAEYYVRKIELIDRNKFVEFPKNFVLVENQSSVGSLFLVAPVKSELQILREKAEKDGLNLKEIARFVELGG